MSPGPEDNIAKSLKRSETAVKILLTIAGVLLCLIMFGAYRMEGLKNEQKQLEKKIKVTGRQRDSALNLANDYAVQAGQHLGNSLHHEQQANGFKSDLPLIYQHYDQISDSIAVLPFSGRANYFVDQITTADSLER